ncbi:hypothetical protein ACHAWF_001229 [Thalassiosira exigua]
MLFAKNELQRTLHRASSNDPDLASLHLCHKKLTNRHLLRIADALKDNTHVVEIWLTHNRIRDDRDGAGGLGYLAAALEGNRTVTELYLGGNQIGAKGASSIANLLQKNNIITDVGLEDNEICDGGAKMLADALKSNSTLQTLKLQGNDIQTTRTIDQIGSKLKENRGSAKEKFEKEHPELKTHKLKKPEEKPKRRSRRKSDGDNEREGRRRRRSGKEGEKEGKEGRSPRPSEEGERPAKPSRGEKSDGGGGGIKRGGGKRGGDGNERRSGGGRSDGRTHPSLENSDAFLEERKKSLEGEKKSSSMTDKLKGMGLGGSKKREPSPPGAGGSNRGMRSAAFV